MRCDEDTMTCVKEILRLLTTLKGNNKSDEQLTMKVTEYVAQSTLLVALTPLYDNRIMPMELSNTPYGETYRIEKWMKGLERQLSRLVVHAKREVDESEVARTSVLKQKTANEIEKNVYLKNLIAEQLSKIGREDAALSSHINAQAKNMEHPATNILALVAQCPEAARIEERTVWSKENVALKDKSEAVYLFGKHNSKTNPHIVRYFDISQTNALTEENRSPHIRRFVESMMHALDVKIGHKKETSNTGQSVEFINAKKTLIIDLSADKNTLALLTAVTASEIIAKAVSDLPAHMLKPVSMLSAMIFIAFYHYAIDDHTIRKLASILQTLEDEHKLKALEFSRQLARDMIQKFGDAINDAQDRR